MHARAWIKKMNTCLEVISSGEVSEATKTRKETYSSLNQDMLTINKSQGQSLSQVGLFLRRPVFSHGQLYVSISSVTSKKGLKLLLCDEKGKPTNKTMNVIFKEVLQKI